MSNRNGACHRLASLGNRTKLHDPTGRTTTVYDSLYRVSSVKNPDNKVVTYLYNAASARRVMIDPDNGRFTHGYDNAGRQRFVINPQNERSTFTWDNAGRMTVQRLANGTRASMTYDAANQMSRIVNYTSANAVLTDFDYARDAVGNPTRVVEANGDRVTYSNDATYQLSRERRSGANAYDATYDAGGNRRAKIDSAARTPSADSGAETECAAAWHNVRLPTFHLRDWRQCDKPSRHDAAIRLAGGTQHSLTHAPKNSSCR